MGSESRDIVVGEGGGRSGCVNRPCVTYPGSRPQSKRLHNTHRWQYHDDQFAESVALRLTMSGFTHPKTTRRWKGPRWLYDVPLPLILVLDEYQRQGGAEHRYRQRPESL